jgi:hypothetical protein
MQPILGTYGTCGQAWGRCTEEDDGLVTRNEHAYQHGDVPMLSPYGDAAVRDGSALVLGRATHERRGDGDARTEGEIDGSEADDAVCEEVVHHPEREAVQPCLRVEHNQAAQQTSPTSEW